ncbi:ABC transporter permease [Ohessyouella blattaphilus]|uniref:ABC transporter permease n=1 Tax=Ohessyouella blattaphilus TaxID=2949333 RepID=A0ABT1EGQ9_9FIRM|nr:ABC transporter permease [Ohessyouella blattaphilus]MCP1109883.1 ABC transporter permease [Ohessyouella blattaphilus]MCR8563277.1 ABC transporter permease [Ohessyouella blattaphilus]
MRSSLYVKLAKTNIVTNRKTYIPYIITAVLTVAMFLIMANLRFSESVAGIEKATLQMILNFGVIIIGAFALIFLFYTNSFLIKRRKKELGIYNILGMEKRHVRRMITLESLFVSLTGIVGGVIIGLLLSRLMYMILQKMVRYDNGLDFEVSMKAIWITLILFGGIFFLILLANLFTIQMTNPIELLRGGKVGEREPKSKWILGAIGLVAIAAGYYIAVTTESPVAALNTFFVAVVLVIIGTYGIFMAGSIIFLKLLKKNKKFYYQTNHFVAVSGMIYRMKQNAVGLANICILSTALLVTISTTVSLYAGMTDMIGHSFPNEIQVALTGGTDEERERLPQRVDEFLADKGHPVKESSYYTLRDTVVVKEGGKLISPALYGSTPTTSQMAQVILMTLDSYNRNTGQKLNLDQNEVLLYTNDKFTDNELTINEQTFAIKKQVKDLENDINNVNVQILEQSYLVVFNDRETILGVLPEEDQDIYDTYGVDFNGSVSEKLEMSESIQQLNQEFGEKLTFSSKENATKMYYVLVGGLLFIGTYFGALFLMATVLIIYYKQISEGYDDKERFGIMKKVGMSKREISKAIKSQVLLVFFLPLIVAVVHVFFAFPVVRKLLAILYLENVGIFMIATAVTILVFALIYCLVYVITAREYYKIVE